MNREQLYRIFEEKRTCPGDTNEDFYEWAIAYLIELVNKGGINENK